MGERLKPPPGHSGLYERRRTRKRRYCDSCRRTFEPGDLYVRAAAPPYSDVGNERWWTLTLCGMETSDCPTARLCDGTLVKL